MPANLPPQFFELQKKLREAKNNEEKIEILEEMLKIVPKHKGTERVQEDLKRKLAKLRKEEKGKPKQKPLFLIKREGAGQVVILGPPNSGKSSLLNALTNAKVKVAPYPFTTQFPQPGMAPFENIFIQLIDTPPITENFFPGWLRGIIKEADVLLILLDLNSEKIFQELTFFQNKISEFLEKKVIWVGNKIETEKAKENFSQIKEKIEIFPISTSEKIGLEELKRKIFEKLEIERVYTKAQGKEPNFSSPFIVKKGTKIIDLALQIHEDLAKNFKFAKLFQKNLKKPKIVGKDYILKDGDIIEIH